MTTTNGRVDAATVLSGLRSAVGIGTWAAPAHSWRIFGLGPMNGDSRSALMSRLFGVRDLALGLALHHPSAEVRKAALQTGIAVDSIDAVASVLAVRAGAPKLSLLGVGAGAVFFVGLGLAGLADAEKFV